MPPAIDDDPLSRAIAPPPNETSEEKAARLAMEREARRVSDEIDQRLHNEKVERRNRKIVKVLLLGQSESGKSTTLKNFQLNYTPHAFQAERESWRSVIVLNLLKSIHTILDVLANLASNNGNGASSSSSPTISASSFTLLQMRLSPLRHAEDLLRRNLATLPVDDPTDTEIDSIFEYDTSSYEWQNTNNRRSQEFTIRNRGTGWQGTLSKMRPGTANSNNGDSKESKMMMGKEDEYINIVANCREDMAALWADKTVRRIVQEKRLRLEESSGFFLDDIDRIARRDYIPSEEDVLRARLRTVGVQEYRLQLETGPERGTEWRVFDVGGSRNQRASWVPFFDDVNAIIFLAPISTFDQVLQEDKRVNRVEDSLLLWKSICANRLLSRVAIILFLNKCDILKVKLESGVRLAKYVPSFKDNPNDMPTVSRYFRAKFKAIHREYSPEPRTFYGHFTNVIEPQETAAIMASVREVIVKEHLKSASIL